jgi:ABC-2 type transport system permease protein
MSAEQTAAAPNGVIHDIGYQRYGGVRLGRAYAFRSLYSHGVRAAFGLGRSAKAKIFPWIVVGIGFLIATVVTAIRGQGGPPVLGYAGYPVAMFFLIIIFNAVVAPELVSRDLRNGILPLYFSRPLTRSDYALAKLAALVTANFLMLAGPQLLMFIGGSFTLPDAAAVWDEFGDLAAGLAVSAMFALLCGSLSLLIASFFGRRAVAAAMVVALFLVTTPIFGILTGIGTDTMRELAGLVSPISLVDGTAHWLFPTQFDEELTYPGSYGGLYAAVTAATVTAASLLLLLRYRKAGS